MMGTYRYLTGAMTLFFCGVFFLSQAQANDDLAKQAQNPVADLISLPFQNNTNFNIGTGQDEVQNVLNIQPVIPFELNESWNLITRTIIPVISQPNFYTGDKGRITGLGDITLSTFLSPSNSSGITWGAGPMFLFPTATDGPLGGTTEDGGKSLGSDKWGGGISAVGLVMPGKWVIGSLVSNVWSFAGSGDRDINLFSWQYFINYNLPEGWYLVSAPIITADWESDSDNTWTIPFGGGLGKLFSIGKQPINTQLSAYYNVEKPDNGPDWQLRFQIQFLFPK
jgi:hypothetical protein